LKCNLSPNKNLVKVDVNVKKMKTTVLGQSTPKKVHNIALFSTLYLDSAFGETGYKYGKLVPSFAVSGVEYYYGAKEAIDSLRKEGVALNYYVFDSKATTRKIADLIKDGDLEKMDMLIGAVSGGEVKLLADFALQKKIPFISASFPNDAGVTNNPNFLIVNSTLKTNCKAIHEFLQNKLKDQRIVFLTKNGKQEERIAGYFKEFEKNSTGVSLGISYIDLGDNVSEDSIAATLDSTLLTTYIVGSTDVAFAKTIAKVIVSNKQQEQINLVGLPTWDDAADFNKKEYNGIHFYYVTPMAKPSAAFATKMGNKFKAKYGSTGGDNLYRGFETVYKYTKLLLKHDKNLVSNLADKAFTTIFAMDVQPVMLNANNMALDYFENKKVSLMRRFNGATIQIMGN
jgi:ABC-type branched-subunit amino acid transport system substrate-binding protein